MASVKSFIIRRHRLILTLAVGLGLTILAAALQPSPTSPVDSYAACAEAGYPILESQPPVCREGTHNFIGTPEPTAVAAPPLTNVSFETLVNGDTHNAVPDHEQVFIDSDAAWQAYWQRVHGGLPTLPPLLPVDFSTSSVVGVSLGQKPTSGYGLKITSVTTTAAGTIVSLTETTPTITCAVTNQLTNRYLIIRTAKLAGPPSYRITSEKRHC